MKHAYVYAALALAAAVPAIAQQPEQQFTITLTQRELFYVGALLDEQKVKDALPLANKIQGQLAAQNQKTAADQQAAYEKVIRDRLAAEAKAKEDAKTAPPPEDKHDP